jgi:hypothetical protein
MKKLIAGLLLLMLQQSIFAQVKISDMPAATGNCAGCLVPVLQSGVNKKITSDNLLSGKLGKTDSTGNIGYVPAWRTYTYWNGSSDNYNGTKTLYYHDGTLVDSLPKTPIVFDSYFIVNADSVFSALRASIGISILDSAGADGHTYKIIRSSGSGGVAGILLSDLSALGPLSYNSSTGVFSADTSKANGKLATYTDIIRNRDSLLTLLAAKQNQINGTGFVKASGTTVSYDNSTYLTPTGNGSALTGITKSQVTGLVAKLDSIIVNAKNWDSTNVSFDFVDSSEGIVLEAITGTTSTSNANNADSLGLKPASDYQWKHTPVNFQTASYTVALTDDAKTVMMNVSTANVVTLPLNSVVAFPLYTVINIHQYGTGQTTITPASGVVIRSAGSRYNLSEQYSECALMKIGTDEWKIVGDLSL